MAIKIVHDYEADKGLEVTEGKLNVKIKAGETVLKVGDEGLYTELPAQQEIPVAFKDASISGTTITFTKTDDSTSTLELPAQTVDVHVSGLTFTDGKLKATLSDGSTAETDFTAEIVVNALKGADSTQKQALKELFVEILKGEEVQDLSGTVKGFLLPA